ncbi:MAG: YdiU family protein [Synechococcales cyanobacterium]
MPSELTIAAPTVGWNFDHSYSQLPPLLHKPQHPVPVKAPRLVILNRPLAQSLGLNPEVLALPEHVGTLAGNGIPAGASPLAQAYAGHQFGYFTVLGDGRALILGEHLTPTGQRVDIQLKGSGRTPFSRRGDGRAALGPMLREYIISEAMQALGIPTTRSLAVVSTGETIIRERLLPGAVLTRVAASHIRVGTFQYAAARGDDETLRALADYTLARHYPQALAADHPYLALLSGVIERQATLVAQWLQVGFIHGVMNTDNMAISGETIDYGPCAFMDTYDPGTVFSSIDHDGRYAYGNQPHIAQWNVARFAETLLPLLHPEPEQAIALAETALSTFATHFQEQWQTRMGAKLGLLTQEAADVTLIQDWLALLHTLRADFTNTCRDLARYVAPGLVPDGDHAPLPPSPFFQDAAVQNWIQRWHDRLARQPQPLAAVQERIKAHCPARIPRNHRVEAAITAAVDQDDLTVMEQLLQALADPYADVPDDDPYRELPPPSDRIYQTFCGT